MSPPFTPPPRFDIGRVISRLVGALQRNAGPFLLCSLVFTGLPLVAVGWFQSGALGADGASANPTAALLTGLAAVPVSLVTSALLQAAIIYGTVNDLNGRRASLGDSLGVGFRLLLPLIGLAILTTLAMAAGFLLFIVPAVLVALAFAVATPVEVVERVGVFAAMGRSAELTRNHRGAIFGLFVLYAIVSFVVSIGGSVLAALVGSLSPLGFVRASYLVVTPLTQSVVALIGAAGVASVYYELRNIKEGIGPEVLAAVFD